MWANPNNMPKVKLAFIVIGIVTLIVTLKYLQLWAILSFLALAVIILVYVWSSEGDDLCTSFHEYVDKPWGGYRNVADGDEYKIKILVIQPNEALSLQSHEHRNESWVIAQGEATVEYGSLGPFDLTVGDNLKVLAGYKHRVTNNSDVPLVIAEVWYGKILDEGDIIRYEDRYGRE